MKIRCNHCRQLIKRKAALVFSPPRKHPRYADLDITTKIHICTKCWPKLKAWIFNT